MGILMGFLLARRGMVIPEWSVLTEEGQRL